VAEWFKAAVLKATGATAVWNWEGEVFCGFHGWQQRRV